ncbi:MraY family glycosyltransferase [Bacillus horti]|uniref:UDP-GlcNAc:undecaprenyl-phosphate GlcNAc-1-phosphate transferase n=1 Tax=Caldalkalibacillus horti TaxID=77523 RepID=A0ABT9W2G6_9BACI|nr:MraY family glycosyltransferase [Bacillus horti]MDQ0167254.1 UDP-GlcNAc:undecaprenyl-phosphate GlcNAc-1-phosphate transferase [Bacillus horti]
MLLYLFPLLSSFTFVYLFIPIVSKWAHQYQIIDRPTQRKQHQGVIPLTGGLAIFLGVMPLVFIFLGVNQMTLTFLLGSVLIVGIGLIDDWYKGKSKELSPWPKLFFQGLAATVLFLGGTRIYGISDWFGDSGIHYFPMWLSFLTTFLWAVGLMNMLNFIDGMDGLASGISGFIMLTLFFIAFLKGEMSVALLAIVMTGAILAFLRHNFHPASIFLGDSGAMFLGFTIAFLSIEGAMKGATLISSVVLLLTLGIPIFDTLQVILTRLKEGRPIYKADRSHLHHRLLSKGLNQRQVIVILYLIGFGFSLMSLFLFFFFD